MNEIVSILQFLVLLCVGVPVAIFGIYGSIILYYNKARKPHSAEALASTEYEPTVSVVVPTHNELSIISKRIENLLASDYPKEKLEILFVDDSSDSTPQIIEEYSKNNP